MVVRIRLQRWGQRNLPFYRIVAAVAKYKRDGRFLERVCFLFPISFSSQNNSCITSIFSKLGTYNPIAFNDGIKEITADSERIKYWLSVGAQPTERVSWILSKVGILPAPPLRNRPSKELPKSLLQKPKT